MRDTVSSAASASHFTFALTVTIPVRITLSILMRKVKQPSQTGHVSVDHLRPTLLEVEGGLMAIIPTVLSLTSSVLDVGVTLVGSSEGLYCIQSDKLQKKVLPIKGKHMLFHMPSRTTHVSDF